MSEARYTMTIRTVVTPDLKRWIDRTAAAQGLTTSSFIRMVLTKLQERDASRAS